MHEAAESISSFNASPAQPSQSITLLSKSISNLSENIASTSSMFIKEDPDVIEKLFRIQNDLQDVLNDVKHIKNPNSLLFKESLPPNKKTRTETAEAYTGRRKVPPMKTAHRRSHIDPYSGGERSGKFAKKDALQIKKETLHTPSASSFVSVSDNFSQSSTQIMPPPSCISYPSNSLQSRSDSVLFAKFRL